MAWIKTEAGKREMQTRSLVNDRARRNLLVLIDGKTSVQALFAKVTAVTETDFESLREAGLIEFVEDGMPMPMPTPTPTPTPTVTPPTDRVSPPTPAPAVTTASPTATAPVEPAPSSLPAPSYAHLSATLTRLVSSELGLRGLPLTLAIEKARSVEDLRRLADTVVTRVRERRGDVSAEAARQALFGG